MERDQTALVQAITLLARETRIVARQPGGDILLTQKIEILALLLNRGQLSLAHETAANDKSRFVIACRDLHEKTPAPYWRRSIFAWEREQNRGIHRSSLIFVQSNGTRQFQSKLLGKSSVPK